MDTCNHSYEDTIYEEHLLDIRMDYYRWDLLHTKDWALWEDEYNALWEVHTRHEYEHPGYYPGEE